MDLFKSLENQDKLPMIVFLLQRQECMRIVAFIVHRLIQKEKKFKKKEGVFEKIDFLKKQKPGLKLQVEKIKKKISSQITQQDQEIIKKFENLKDQLIYLKSRDQRFCYVLKKNCLTEDELQDYLPSNHQNNLKNGFLIEGLMRGIAVHHAGLPKKYRQAVERLFRLKKIGVVIGTGTLALGLNMPAKTVFFLEDSLFINTMSFRQMAGRAGRRGFDLRGNILIGKFQKEKVQRLLTYPTSSLKPNISLSPTLVLRILLNYQQSHENEEEKEKIFNTTKLIIDSPFMKYLLNSNIYSNHFQYHFRFCLEFLVQEEFIDQKGIPLDFCGLLCHLYWLEPVNFVFVHFLRQGLFHSLLEDQKKNLEWELLEILCHFFCCQPILSHLDYTTKTSIVYLPPLKPRFQKALIEYNQRVLKIASDFLIVISNLNKVKTEQLPLSKIDFKTYQNNQLDNDFHVPSSPFVNISKFSSVQELCETAPPQLFSLEPSMLPMFEKPDENLNSYILDFYKHGQEKVLIIENQMEESVRNTLKDFSLILKAISVAMRRRVVNQNNLSKTEKVVELFERVAKNFQHKFNSAFSVPVF